jgi:hypothetical protein
MVSSVNKIGRKNTQVAVILGREAGFQACRESVKGFFKVDRAES